MDAFKNTKPKKFNSGNAGGGFIRDFYFQDNMALPFQVINVGIRPDLFPEGFPKVNRHWVIVGQHPDGRDKYAFPPPYCTQGHPATGGNCLTCYGKATGQLNADRGAADASEDIVVPVFEHTRYRKVGNKYQALNPNIPLDNPQGTFEGGFKIMWASGGQFRKLRVAHNNAQNVCAGCGGYMQTASLECGECSAEQFNAQQLVQFNNEQLEELLYGEFTCPVCNHEGGLVEKKVCQQCQGSTPKTLYDVVILGQKQKVPTSGGGEKTEYSFPEAPQFPLKTFSDEDMNAFLEKVHNMISNPPSIAAQKKVLQIQPPAEWEVVSTPQSQPYGT